MINKRGKNNLSLYLQYANCPHPGNSNHLVASLTYMCSVNVTLNSSSQVLMFGNGYLHLTWGWDNCRVDKCFPLSLKRLTELNYTFHLLVDSRIKSDISHSVWCIENQHKTLQEIYATYIYEFNGYFISILCIIFIVFI